MHKVADWIREVADGWGEELTGAKGADDSSQERRAATRPVTAPAMAPARNASSRLCPPSNKWYIVSWTLQSPYDFALWGRSLKEAARRSLISRLRGSEQYPELIRLKELTVRAEGIAPWGKQVPVCSGPSLAAEFW